MKPLLLPGTSRRLSMLLGMALLALVLGVTWWAYHPGLSGGFQFDDFANLPAIGATGPINTWPNFWRYITSGHADPTGRPIALLSFLVDARNWPASPYPFLRTNVLLHLGNGVLLFALLCRLGRILVSRTGAITQAPRVPLAAFVGAALWLLHPLQVSTTLYIVQREAMLPATFTLLGLLAWLRGRERMLDGYTLRGACWILAGLGLGTALGVLSKANGILLPALALVLEWTVLQGQRHTQLVLKPVPSRPDARRAYRRVMLILAGLPTVFVAGYLLWRGYQGMAHGISSTRPWTLGERLLTEPRVLMDYLQLLWLPHPFTPGLFNDQIQASTSLLTPWTTLPCLLAVVGLIAGACMGHRRWPAWALAVLFYFVGQSLESSTIALELYFEHRNYLPSLLLFWPLALWLCGIGQSLPTRSGRPSIRANALSPRARWLGKAALTLIVLTGLAAMTHARASVWGNTQEQALLWARLNPDSPRAQANAAMAQMHAGHPAAAAIRLERLLQSNPDQVQLAFNLFAAQCQMGYVPPATMAAARQAMATTRNPGALLAHWFGRAIGQTRHPPCPQLTLDTLTELVHAGQSNPELMAIHGRRQDLDSMLGNIALARGLPDQALADFNRALDQGVRPTTAFAQAAQLGSHGYPQRGLAHLAYYERQRSAHPPAPAGASMPRVHAWVLARQGYWPNEMVHLRHTLQADADAKARAAAPAQDVEPAGTNEPRPPESAEPTPKPPQT